MRSDSTDKAVQKERLLAVLALIRTGMEMGSLKWSMGEHQADSKEVAERLMKDVRILSEQLEKGLSGHFPFSLRHFPLIVVFVCRRLRSRCLSDLFYSPCTSLRARASRRRWSQCHGNDYQSFTLCKPVQYRR